MESQPQNPEFRINPDNFPPCLIASLHRVTLELKYQLWLLSYRSNNLTKGIRWKLNESKRLAIRPPQLS